MHLAAPPLIGREAALAAVGEAIGADRAVAVVGEAGIGKTALVRAAALASGRHTFEGGGFATLADLPYFALRRALGAIETRDVQRVAATVEAAVGPNLLFIDDLQWTDPATRQVVTLLLGRIAIAVAIREGDPATAGAIAPFEGGTAEIIRLRGLDRAAALELAGRLQPGATAARLERIVDAAGGNPLVIEELAAHGGPSSTLTRAILGQVDALPAEERAALELVALAGRPLAAAALGDAGQALLARGLVHDTGDGLLIRHGLIGEAIAAQVDEARRPAAYALLAAMVSEPTERARHLLAAGRRDEAREVALAALEEPRDPRTRALLLSVAAEAAGPEGDALRVEAAELLRGLGSTDVAIALLQRPVQGDDDLRGLSTAVLASSLDHEGRHDEAIVEIEKANGLSLTPGGVADTSVALAAGVIVVNQGRLAEGIAILEGARDRAGDGPEARRLVGHLEAVRIYAGLTEDLGALEAAVAATIAGGDGGGASGRAMDLYYSTMALNGGAASYAVAMDYAERIDATGYRTRANELRAEAAQAAIFAGQLAGTVLHVDSMLEEPLGLLSRQRLLYNRGLALGLLGHAEEADRTFGEAFAIATDVFDGRGATLWCWSEASWWSGRVERALEQAVASLEYVAWNDAEFVLPSLARAWAELELGQAPTPMPVDVPFRMLAGSRPEHAGLVALAAGDVDTAAERFAEAAALWAGFHIPREQLCRWAAAEALRRAGDRDAAVAGLREVLDAAHAIGFEPLVVRVRRSLRLAGERTATAARSDPAIGLLTGREREILGLVERGLTNAEIARRMGLGRPTVARILSNAMIKLGAESRGQAVALASEPV